jgi:hypothetical protein
MKNTRTNVMVVNIIILNVIVDFGVINSKINNVKSSKDTIISE